MRLATFNLLGGLSLVDGRVDPDRLIADIASLDADVLGRQEVDRATPRSDGVDMAALAAETVGPQAAWRFAPALMGTPRATWAPAVDGDEERGDAPAFGIALVS